MILDHLTLWTVAAMIGWGAALILLVLFLKRGALAERLREDLSDSRQTAAMLETRLEAFDATRDDLEMARGRIAELERQETSLTTRLEERERHLADLRERLENEFRSMSSKLVREAGDALMREASQTFEKQQLSARKDAETYSKSVSDLLKPMRDTLTRYEEGLREMRDQHQKNQGELTGQIATLAKSASAVQAEARSLATALTAGPKARGRWGETTLRNVVEMAGLSPYCDFTEQHSVTDEVSRKQPDMVVRLPGERMVAIDSKVSLNDWLDAAAAEEEAARTSSIQRHGRSVWTHVQALAAKDYAGALKKDGAIDFVVMFMPGETFFTAAVDARPTLFEDAYARGVLIATPTTLIAILKSIAHAWRQQKTNENARAVAGMAAELYDSLRKTGDHLSDLGKHLDRTVDGYNKLVGNMESRVMPKARRFAEYEMPGTEKPVALITHSEADVRSPSPDRDLIIETRRAAS